jgi:beta-mannosidase
MTQPPNQPSLSATSARARVEGHELRTLSTGWQAAPCPPDLHIDTKDLNALSWHPARAGGTAAAVLDDAGLWRLGEPYDFDAEDWWFRTSFDCEPAGRGEEVSLCLDGIATVAEVYLNGELVLESDSMFARHSLDIGALLRNTNELAIRCRALGPLLRVRRRPRARWRTRLVSEGNLRFFRTMLLGRAPGFAPGPAAVGPWRPVRLERHRRLSIEELALRPRIEGGDGVLSIRTRIRPLDGTGPTSVEVELDGPSGAHRAQLALSGLDGADAEEISAQGELIVVDVARWWPHTHGKPALHDIRLLVEGEQGQLTIHAGRVGFRDLAFGANPDHDVEQDGLDLHVNGVQVFARGAVWTPIDSVGLAPSEGALRDALERAREAGMNMLRLPGTGAYETGSFHDLCDELGILVWQDFMFANLDYPIADEAFRNSVEREARGVLEALAGRPSLAVLCGNSEIEQQVAMLGLDPSLGRGELFGELLPAFVRESGVDAVYVPSAPCGGELPFRPDRGIANYYGVGGYRRPLEDVRRAGVRFAAECLAFSNVPAEEGVEELLPKGPAQLAGHNSAWKAGIPRDLGADWDFEDVRDHYLKLLFGVDVPELRRVDHARYLELSRTVTGEVMAEVFGEWRRAASPCGGGLVLWLHDLLPGAGWGLIDHQGAPKGAYHHLKRALAPVAVWTVDEGLAGVVVHVANDGPTPLIASLRVALYRDHEHRVEEARLPVELEPHSQMEWNVETLIGHFMDVGWAYRFGPPAQDAIVASLECDDSGHSRAGVPRDDSCGLISQAVRFPAGRPLQQEPSERLGLRANARTLAGGEVELVLASRRLAYGVRVHAPGYVPADDCFTLEPGLERLLTLQPSSPDSSLQAAALSAVNMHGRVRATLET